MLKARPQSLISISHSIIYTHIVKIDIEKNKL